MVAAALGVLALAFGTWFAIRPANDSGHDLPIYEEYASMVLDGQNAYRDVRMEYPPEALPMFVWPAVAVGDGRDAHWSPPNDAGRRNHRAFDSLADQAGVRLMVDYMKRNDPGLRAIGRAT